MFQALRKAVSGNQVKDPRNSLVQDEYRKKKLKENLSHHIKELQKGNVGGTKVIERNDENAQNICQGLEAIFLHEYHVQSSSMQTISNINLRMMFSEGIKTDDAEISMAFWDLLKEVTHNDVIAELRHLVVTTEVGLCRAWIRLALNDCLLINYIDAILSNRLQLKRFYSVNAFLMDNELPFILKDLLNGLLEFEFRLNYNSSKLNTWDRTTLQLSGILLEYVAKSRDNISSDKYSSSSHRSIKRSSSIGTRSDQNLSSSHRNIKRSSSIGTRNDQNLLAGSNSAKQVARKGVGSKKPCDNSINKEKHKHQLNTEVSPCTLVGKNNPLSSQSANSVQHITLSKDTPTPKNNKEEHITPGSNRFDNRSQLSSNKEDTNLSPTKNSKDVINEDQHQVIVNSNEGKERSSSASSGDVDGEIASLSQHFQKALLSLSNNNEDGNVSIAKNDVEILKNTDDVNHSISKSHHTPPEGNLAEDYEEEAVSTLNTARKEEEEDAGVAASGIKTDNLQNAQSSQNKSIDTSPTDCGLPKSFTDKPSGKPDTNIGSTKESTEEIDQFLPGNYGNRLNGMGWAGWSSSFDDGQEDCESTEIDYSDSPAESDCNNDMCESFGSILLNYENSPNYVPTEYLKIQTDQSNNKEEIEQKGSSKMEKSVNVAHEGVVEGNKSDNNPPLSHTDTGLSSSILNLNFEIVPMDAPLQGQNVDTKTLSSLNQLTEIASEKGLDKQGFCCEHCGVLIGLIYGPYRICRYDGAYYCHVCHEDEEHIIPARVIQDWDFRKYKVSKYNKVFLMKIEEEPLFHMDELNSLLYDVVPDLKSMKYIRIQLQHIKEYVQTCRREVAEDFRRRLWPREYLCDDIHQYSLLDLVQVYNGQQAHHLKKIITQFSKHIFSCTLCCQKGFICEYCHDETIIYPFQVNIAVQCQGCLTTFHKACRQDKRCPKCVRLRLRVHKGKNENEADNLVVSQKVQVSNDDIL